MSYCRKKKTHCKWKAALLILITVPLVNCGANRSQEADSSTVKKGRAQMWGETCARCHNMRSPASYSDKNWDIAVLHMRIRAYMTAEEHEAIVEFLKAGN